MKVSLSREGQKEKGKEREKKASELLRCLSVPMLKHHFEECSIYIRMANRRGQQSRKSLLFKMLNCLRWGKEKNLEK